MGNSSEQPFVEQPWTGVWVVLWKNYSRNQKFIVKVTERLGENYVSLQFY